MFCTKCGAKLEEGAKFCSSCGAVIEQVDGGGAVSGVGIGREETMEKYAKVEKPISVASGKEQTVAEANNVRRFRGDSKRKFYIGKLLLTNKRLLYLSSGKKSGVIKDSVVGGQVTVEYLRSRKTKELDRSALKKEGSIEAGLEDILVCEEERWALAKLLHVKLRNGEEYRFSILGEGSKPKEFAESFLRIKGGM
jgi:hypothetical protein